MLTILNKVSVEKVGGGGGVLALEVLFVPTNCDVVT